jgi:hypothetical protein
MFTILMAMVVLLSSTGFGLVEHNCMMSGKSVQLVSLGESSGCQGCKKVTSATHEEASYPVFKKKACCDESQKHEKIEVVSVSPASVKILKSAVNPAAFFSQSFRATLGNLQSIAVGQSYLLSSFSSLHYGRAMLSFVQSFLI